MRSETLHDAVKEGHLEVIKSLLEQGAAVNATDNNEGWTALQLAAWAGHLAVVRYLVEQGAGVKATDNEGRTALHGAALAGRLAVVRYLVVQGADVNAKNNKGEMALHSAEASSQCPQGWRLKVAFGTVYQSQHCLIVVHCWLSSNLQYWLNHFLW